MLVELRTITTRLSNHRLTSLLVSAHSYDMHAGSQGPRSREYPPLLANASSAELGTGIIVAPR